MENLAGLFGKDLCLISSIVRENGDCGLTLLCEANLQRGTGEPVCPVEADAEGGGGGPCVGTRGMPRGGEIAEVALKGWVVVGQSIELGFYPLAVTKGEGVCLAHGVMDVEHQSVGMVAEAEALPVQRVLGKGVACGVQRGMGKRIPLCKG